jgi:short-subunit dehydrogenase
MPQFRDKIVVITGATSGIGRAAARAFSAAGARVLGTGRHQGRLAELAREVDLALTVDVTEARDVDLLRTIALDRYGRVDVLVNNAGVGLFEDWESSSVEQLQRLLEVNLIGAQRVAQALVPGMVERGEGHLVQVASIAGKRGFERQSAYCASKHALIGWSEAVRQELRGSGVKVHVICPPAVDTPFFATAGWPGIAEEHRRWRPISPEAVAASMLDAIRKDQRQVILTPRARALHMAAAHLPEALDKARARWAWKKRS